MAAVDMTKAIPSNEHRRHRLAPVFEGEAVSPMGTVAVVQQTAGWANNPSQARL